jgi:hypothetical protein
LVFCAKFYKTFREYQRVEQIQNNLKILKLIQKFTFSQFSRLIKIYLEYHRLEKISKTENPPITRKSFTLHYIRKNYVSIFTSKSFFILFHILQCNFFNCSRRNLMKREEHEKFNLVRE